MGKRKIIRVRKKLLAFTDTKAEAIARKKMWKRRGFVYVTVKKEYGAYGVYGKKPKIIRVRKRKKY